VPRVNPNRSLANEENLARRIAHEREARGWSYEGIAERLTRAGYPIHASAVFKIEKGKPARRVTVDELVGFATVFEIPIGDMLEPMATVIDRAALELLRSIDMRINMIGGSTAGIQRDLAEFAALEHVSPEISDRLHALLSDATTADDMYLIRPEGRSADLFREYIAAVTSPAAVAERIELGDNNNG
jgi:transcriptional regulator with XRE-family HTH domain